MPVDALESRKSDDKIPLRLATAQDRCYDPREVAMNTAKVSFDFARLRFGRDVDVKLLPLQGGLETPGIARADVYRRHRLVGCFVVKPLYGEGTREALVYDLLQTLPEASQLSPAWLGCERTDHDQAVAFLEWLPSRLHWPWRDLKSSLVAINQLASLHRIPLSNQLRLALSDWDYDRTLMESAKSTLETYSRVWRTGVRPGVRPMVRPLERLVGILPRIRRQLLSFAPPTFIHGDAHAGNVVFTSRPGQSAAVFIDWARARVGSPLEDVSSWVHSLSVWEPVAKRSHDTLLQRYRRAGGHESELPRDFRDACILAGASNALAGALRYHLTVIADPQTAPRRQFDSYCAAAAWLRIVYRADVCFNA
jgi:hypothetical protein